MAREDPAVPRKRPRQRRSRETVDAILVAAARILETEGFERATTNRIAERAGVSIGSLYQYLPSKHAIVAALSEQRSEWFDGCLRAEIARIGTLPLPGAARSVVEVLIALHTADLALHNALAGPRGVPHEHELGFRRMLQEGLEQRRHELRPLDAELASFIAIRALEAVVHGAALDEPGRLDDPRFAEEVTALLVRYLAR